MLKKFLPLNAHFFIPINSAEYFSHIFVALNLEKMALYPPQLIICSIDGNLSKCLPNTNVYTYLMYFYLSFKVKLGITKNGEDFQYW